MVQAGFQEAQADFIHVDARGLIGQVRRFGPIGPAYEVINVLASGDTLIEVVESGERLDYPLAELLGDPMAEIVP